MFVCCISQNVFLSQNLLYLKVFSNVSNTMVLVCKFRIIIKQELFKKKVPLLKSIKVLEAYTWGQRLFPDRPASADLKPLPTFNSYHRLYILLILYVSWYKWIKYPSEINFVLKINTVAYSFPRKSKLGNIFCEAASLTCIFTQ